MREVRNSSSMSSLCGWERRSVVSIGVYFLGRFGMESEWVGITFSRSAALGAYSRSTRIWRASGFRSSAFARQRRASWAGWV